MIWLLALLGCANPLEECRVACDLPLKKCKEEWNHAWESSTEDERANELGWKSKEEMIEATCPSKGRRQKERKECLEDCVLRHGK